MSRSRDRSLAGLTLLNRIGPMLLVLAAALPVAFLRMPPMIDVLGHLGRYELQTSLAGDPWLQQFYTFRWQVIGNLGVDLFVQAVHRVVGVEASVWLALVLVPLSTASGIVSLSRVVHGRVTPFAVCAIPLIYALPFTWGFLNFSLSMALALVAFACWLRLGPGRMRTILFVLIGLALWLCHTFGWAFLGILCTAEILARARQEGRSWLMLPLCALRDAWPLLMPLIPMLAWRSTVESAGISGWFNISEKAAWLIGLQRLSWEWTDKICAGLILAVIYVGFRSARTSADARLATAAGLAIAAFLLLPGQIFGSVYADMRLAPYAVMLALLALRDNGTIKLRETLMVLAIVFAALRLALTGYVYAEREAVLRQELAALDVLPRHARVATLVVIPCQNEWTLPWFSHIGSLALLRRHAFANDQWANASMNPLQVHFSAAEPFATDDKQLVFAARCKQEPTLRRQLRRLPVRAFTHLWIVGAKPGATPPRAGLQRVWSGRNAAVYRVLAPQDPDRSAH